MRETDYEMEFFFCAIFKAEFDKLNK